MRALRSKQVVAKAGHSILVVVQFRVADSNDSGVGDKRNTSTTGGSKPIAACPQSRQHPEECQPIEGTSPCARPSTIRT